MLTEAPNTIRRNNLPRRLSPLVGRETELAQIRAQLLDPVCRLLTLIGPGGIGKTRLALVVAETLVDEFANDVCFVELQPLNDPAQLPNALADALALPLAGAEPVEQQLQHYLANKEMLLLLDNVEHLLAGVEFLAALLAHAPGLKLLVTSREVLNLQEEWLFPLTGLTAPPSEFDLVTIEQYSAVQLFLERMRRLRPHFVLAEEAVAVASICQLVEGMPLALELAATWTKALSCAEIVDEIKRGLDFLATNVRNVSARHRSMLAVFQQSWQQLTAAEQTAFAHLSVFRGGFRRPAAEQVAGATLSTLSALVDKSLLRWESTGRYQIHELLRQYGAEQLAKTPAAFLAAQTAHCRYFCDFLHKQLPATLGGDQARAINEISAEHDNVRVAWQWAVDQAEIAEMRKAVNALYRLYEFQSRYLEGANIFEAALGRLDELAPSATINLVRTEILASLGWLSNRLGRLTRAKAVLLEAQALYEQLNQPPVMDLVPDPRAALGINALIQGDYADALAYAEQVRQSSEEHNHPWNRRLAYYVLAGATLAQGDYHTAQRYAETCYAIVQSIGDRWFMAYCLNEMGHIARALGQEQRAQAHYEISYRLRKEFGDPEGMAVALGHLGSLALQRKEYAQAQAHFQESLTLYRAISDKGGLARVLHGLGSIACTQNQLAAAQHYLRQALGLAAEIHFTALLFPLIVTIGDCLMKNNQPARGLALLTFIQRHPNCPHAVRTQAEQLLDQYRASSSTAVPAALEAPTWHSTEVVVAALLADTDWLRNPSPGSTQGVVAPASQHAAANNLSLVEPLTKRELEILQLIAAGLTNEQIANQLIIAIGTVKSYSGLIYSKLGVNSRTQAATRARKLGLIKA